MATIWRWLDPDHEAVAGEVQACLRRPNGLDLNPWRTVMTQRERQIPKALRTPRSLAAAMLMALAGAALAQDANERPGKHPEEAGQAAYLANCAACHQPTGKIGRAHV